MQTRFNIPRFRLPPLLSAIGRRLPQWPPALALATALNAANRLGVLPGDAIESLEGRTFRIDVLDAGSSTAFCCCKGSFRPHDLAGEVPDLVFSANLSVFLQLLLRQEDPDTLFFNRELAIEGDTELGLLVKNMLDAIEWPQMQWPLPLPGR